MGNRNSGPRPQPAALKALRGFPGKRPVHAHEVRPPAGEVTKPTGLSLGAGLIWDELAPVCVGMGTLTIADVRPFASLCELQATFTATARLKDTDPGTFNGKVESELATRLRPFYEYFGLTAWSRARISVPPVEAPVSKWAGIE